MSRTLSMVATDGRLQRLPAETSIADLSVNSFPVIAVEDVIIFSFSIFALSAARFQMLPPVSETRQRSPTG